MTEKQTRFVMAYGLTVLMKTCQLFRHLLLNHTVGIVI